MAAVMIKRKVVFLLAISGIIITYFILFSQVHHEPYEDSQYAVKNLLKHVLQDRNDHGIRRNVDIEQEISAEVDYQNDIDGHVIKQGPASCDPQQHVLLTLFTTFYDVTSRRQIHNNTLHNWASLGPQVRALVYLDESQQHSKLYDIAVELGWCVQHVPLYREKLPVVRAMFLDATNKYQSKYYGYANSDILFDYSMARTLKGLSKVSYEQFYNKKGLLVIGKRTNVDTKHINATFHPQDIPRIKKKGAAFLSLAQDYFITTNKGFPWQTIPDLVVGRPGFDNFFVIKSVDWNLTTIDATDTLTAVHQTGNDGNQASFKSTNRCLNKDLVHPFDYTRGSTLCAPYFSMTTLDGHIAVGKRPWFPDKCNPNTVREIVKCKERGQ